MKVRELERMAPMRRRRFLKLLSAALAAPAIPSALRFAANEIAGGEAWAATQEGSLPTYLIEVNLRDQWDHGHLMVAPGLATHANLKRGTDGRKAALFYRPDELRQVEVNGTNVYLTDESLALEPHLDTIAMVDTCEVAMGQIHGHESGNPMRSPGRNYSQRPGTGAMWLNDPVDNFPQGCEAFYTSTPTPATVHNYCARQAAPQLKEGFTFKGISRGIHTAYHYAGALGAEYELKRHYSRDTLFSQFPDTVQDYNILDDPNEAEAVAAVLGKVDPYFLDRRRYADEVQTSHGAQIASVPDRLYVGEPKLISLPLSEEEVAYWSADVPGQATSSPVRAQIWEQMAWTSKIVSNDLTRAVSLEFDYVDTHDFRTETQLRTEAAQVARPLSRLIEQLKAAGIYDRTLIAIYCTDGGRSPAGGSYGDEGKNTVVLAGGMIRGGYWGDIRVAGDQADGHLYSYHAPDPATGAPGAGVTDNSGRISGAQMWRTVMKAVGTPDSLCDQFPDVAGVAPLSFLLRS